MTQRKPAGIKFESWIDRQIRQAAERGEFEDLPGHGAPLADLDKPYDEMWWVKRKLRDEQLSYLPPSLALRKDAREVRFMQDEWYRKRCRKEPGACQREVVEHAATVLERSFERCNGDVVDALGAYNTGHCGGNRSYAKGVLITRNELRTAAGYESEVVNVPKRKWNAGKGADKEKGTSHAPRAERARRPAPKGGAV